nr:putative ribonuclease H-like domain-containing protein [Tanacetum cinerariifolium]
MFQHLSRYPTSVCVFPEPILFLVGLKTSWEHGQQRPAIMVGEKGIYLSYFFLHFPFLLIYDLLSLFAEMAFRNFIYTEDDDDLAFLPNEPSLGFGIGSPSASVNMEPLKDVEEPKVQPTEVTADSGESLKVGLFVMHPRSVAARIKDRKCKIKEGSSRPPVKRKLASGSSSSCGLPDCFEPKGANACHLKNSVITLSAWKCHLDNQMDLELLDLHDCFYTWQVVVDNVVNRRAHEILQVIKKMSGEADVIKARKRSCEEECEGLRVKCEAAMAEFVQNPVVLALQENISSLTADLKQDRRDVVSKVLPYAAMKLVHSDELGRLLGNLVSSAITYGRCRAYEQVTAMKDPFDISKAKGYCSSYQKDHTQASNDFATATFPWLDEFVSAAITPIETLLSKKPPMVTASCIVGRKRNAVDFLVVIPSKDNDRKDKPKEVPNLSSKWRLYTDEASNSDRFEAGLMLIDPEGKEYTYALRFEFETRNNVAEYKALLAGLWIAHEMEISKAAIFLDSQLLVAAFRWSPFVRILVVHDNFFLSVDATEDPFLTYGMYPFGPLRSFIGFICRKYSSDPVFESDFTITKLRVSVLEKGASLIVISNETSPTDQERSLENPTIGVLRSTLVALMLPLLLQPMYMSSPLDRCKWMEGPWRDVRPNFLFLSHEQNLKFIALHVNLGSARSVAGTWHLDPRS